MQSWAILVDSYRLLLSRKLFWITLIISAVVVLFYASIGFNEKGFFLLFGAVDFQSEIFKAGTEWSKTLYLGIFSYFIVGIWLTWAAIILALISTTPIFNDFMADGSIDLVLSKPISRVWVFFVKYLGSLLFVVAQVALFAVGVFLCAGWRIGVWEWKIFWAIPIVTVFFSYLYCVSVLLTMWTRSTMASLLLTILFWFGIYAIDTAEQVVNQNYYRHVVRAEAISPDNPTGFSMQPPRQTGNNSPASKAALEKQREQLKAQAERNKKEALEDAEKWGVWRDRMRWIQAFVPKTRLTIAKLDTWILGSKYSMGAIMRGEPQRARQSEQAGGNTANTNVFMEAQRRMEEDYKNRSAWYIIGTSLLFEAVVLVFACYLFYRRDF